MSRPIGVTIIGVLQIIGGILEIILAILLMILVAVISPVLLILPIIYLVIGIVMLSIAFSFFRGKNWARITYIVLWSIVICSNIANIIMTPTVANISSSVINMIIPGISVSYLLFSKKVKRYFRR